MQVLSVASEIYPLIKTGGLADVAGALPKALARQGVRVVSLAPGYPAVIEALEKGAKPVLELGGPLFPGPARLLAGVAAGLELLVLDAPELFRRPGNPYAEAPGRDWPDNAQRFAALAKAAATIGAGGAPSFRPDVLHAHDWQAALAPAYLHYAGGARPGTILTVHNLAFQGVFPASLLAGLELPARAFSIDGVEYFGAIGFLKAGLRFADRITTVSPTYAAEISTPEGGMGLGGLLQARSDVLSGILNGIDDEVWNPATDPHLVSRFTSDSLDLRRANKQALQDRFGLAPDPDALLFAVISRLSGQKGLDLLLEALPALLGQRAQLAVLGSGDEQLEQGFRAATASGRGRVGLFVGYDEPLAHLVQGGADVLLVPSRFEPCGLTQLCAMRYGTIPLVARVGGLSDTIVDANEVAMAAGVATGFQFAPVTRQALENALRRVADAWRDRSAWRRMQRNGMALDLGWNRAARRYADLYRQVADARKADL